MRPRRRVARVTFADGSACGCGDGCWLLEGGCCDGMDEWRRARRRRGGDGGGDGGGGDGGGGDGSAQADDASLSSLERACAHAARPPLTAQGEEAAPCPQPNASYAKSKPGGGTLANPNPNPDPDPNPNPSPNPTPTPNKAIGAAGGLGEMTADAHRRPQKSRSSELAQTV